MARRRPARGGRGGGDVVQASRPTRPRLIAAAAALALCAALGAYPAHGTDELGRVLVLGGVVAALFIAAALLFGWEQLVPWALGVLGAEYAISLFIRGGGSEDAAPFYGAALLLLGELVAWSIALRARMREERPVLLLRLGAVAGAVAASAALGTILLGLAASDAGGGLGWTVVGMAAAVAVVALVVRAARASG